MSVEDFVSRLDAKRSGKGWVSLCPAHEDRTPSLSIDEGADGRVLLKCHAGCNTDDVLAALGITRRDLFPEPINGNGAVSQSRSYNLKEVRRETSIGNGNAKPTPNAPPFDWQACVDAFTDKHVEQLARWRGCSVEFCSWLRAQKLVGLYDSHIAFPVHDSAGRIVGAHYRIKGKSEKDKPLWCYAQKGTKTAPFIIGELVTGEPVHVFESQWDAFAYMDVSGERSNVIVTRGASNGRLVAGVIPEGATLILWPQNDGPGEKWAQDVCSHVKCVVKRVRTPDTHKDLNDHVRTGATADDLLAAIMHAEVIREAEKNWIQALNESIVTSRELRDLELVPRKKLLADWFCEGDLGFIFAFRGVGKTWFALAIAQALSTGGKLGDWQAHKPVSVLYVDGEMPPDLMRTRCEGLGASNANLHFLNHELLFERAGKVLNIANPEIQRAITTHCVAKGFKVLVLDNLSTLSSGMRENEADSWELVNSWLLELRRRKIAVIIVHHAGRSGEMRGTSKREDNVFWIIALDASRTDDNHGARFTSRFTKPSRNSQEDVPAYAWHFVTESSGEVAISCKQAHALDVFRQLVEEGVTECDQIAQEMKVPKYVVSRLAHKAKVAGWLEKEGREYKLVEGEK